MRVAPAESLPSVARFLASTAAQGPPASPRSGVSKAVAAPTPAASVVSGVAQAAVLPPGVRFIEEPSGLRVYLPEVPHAQAQPAPAAAAAPDPADAKLATQAIARVKDAFDRMAMADFAERSNGAPTASVGAQARPADQARPSAEGKGG